MLRGSLKSLAKSPNPTTRPCKCAHALTGMSSGRQPGSVENVTSEGTRSHSTNPRHAERTLVGWRRCKSEPSLVGALRSLAVIDEASARKVKLERARKSPSECKIFVTL